MILQPNDPVNATSNRIFGLDILRAAAILFVMQSHSLAFMKPYVDVHYYWLFILDGVDLFFVLSGFLIGGILIRTINNNSFTWTQLANFWKRRWFRTLPNYFLVLIVLLFGYYFVFDKLPDKFLHYFSFTQCFNEPHPRFFPEAWSLAVEEWFYLLIPLGLFVVLYFAGNKRKAILAWIYFVIVAATAYRWYRVYTFDYPESLTHDFNMRGLVLTRLDSIMYGFLGAYLLHYRAFAWEKRKNLLFALGLLLLFGSRIVAADNLFYYKYLYVSAQSIGTLLLLPKLNSVVQGKGLVYRAITFISIISYSMYLLNFTIVLKIIIPKIMILSGMNYKTNMRHGIIGYTLFWAITIFLSWLLYRLYERPMMNLRQRRSVLEVRGSKFEVRSQ
jgi:peptidoglycan/LPS O-acetylase OafA/YrhL